MPATARATHGALETLPLEERIRWRAHELYVQRETALRQTSDHDHRVSGEMYGRRVCGKD
jgi:hypothetical protein